MNLKNWPLKLVVVISGVGLLLAGVGGIIQWVRDLYNIPSGVLGILLLFFGIALLRLTVWAGKLAMGLYLLTALLLPLGMINPFRAGDQIAAGQQPSTLAELLVILVPVVTASLFCAHILGKYKDQFRNQWI